MRSAGLVVIPASPPNRDFGRGIGIGFAVKPVIQEESTGCGIAAVAAVTGVSYARVKRVAGSLEIHAADPRLWSDTAYVQRLLSRFGVPVARSVRPFRSWASLPARALLAIKWHIEDGRPCWHWVVFARERQGSYVLDSNRTLKIHVRTDFGRMKPKWYLPVFKHRRARV